jgi:hypothetical protein
LTSLAFNVSLWDAQGRNDFNMMQEVILSMHCVVLLAFTCYSTSVLCDPMAIWNQYGPAPPL